MKTITRILGGNLRQYTMVLALVLLILFFHWQTSDKTFLTWLSTGKMIKPTNFMNLLNGNSYVLVMAIGMMFVIVAGHIDLAIGSVAAVVGVCVAISLRDGSAWWWVGIPFGLIVALVVGVVLGRAERRRHPGEIAPVLRGAGIGIATGAIVGVGVCLLVSSFGVPWWLGIIIGITVGILIGCWQGSWLAFVGVPGFITTLAGMMLFRGVYRAIGNAQSIPVPPEIVYIGSGYLPDFGRQYTGLNNSTLILGIVAIILFAILDQRRRAKMVEAGMEVPPIWASIVRVALLAVVIGFLTYLFGSGPDKTSFPVTGIILVFIVIVYNFIGTRTTIGRGIYAVGGNRIAAGLTGINTKKIYFLVLTNMSFLASLAAIMYVGRSRSTGPADGQGWELDAIAAVFIGGAAVTGGIGTVFGCVVGGMVMATLNNGLYLMGVTSDKMAIIKGLVLLVAVAFDLYNKVQGRASIIGQIQRAFSRKPAAESALTSGSEFTDFDESDGSVDAAVEGASATSTAEGK